MKIYNKKLIMLIAAFIFLVGAGNVSAQTDSQILKTLEEVSDKLKESNIKIVGLESQLQLKNDIISLKDEKFVLVQERSDFYKKAYEDSTKIDNNQNLIVANLRTSIADYRQELTELRSENDKLRSSRTFRSVVAFGAGIGTGYFLKKN